MFRLTTIVNGVTIENELNSRRVQLDGECLLVGSKEGISDTLLRFISMATELRNEIESEDW